MIALGLMELGLFRIRLRLLLLWSVEYILDRQHGHDRERLLRTAQPPHSMASALNKRQQARNERALQDLIKSVAGNDRCADCGARNPGA